MIDYEVGDVIEYDVLSESGENRVVEITDKFENIKNGRPGFDGVVVEPEDDNIEVGDRVWGYDDRVIRVIET